MLPKSCRTAWVRWALSSVLLLLVACSDLQETPLNEYTPQNYFRSDQSLLRALIPAYAKLRQYTWDYWNMSSLTSNEVVITGQHNFENQFGLQFHQFLIQPSNYQYDTVGDLWKWLYEGVGACNNALYVYDQLPDSKEKSHFVAEARVLRAFYYYLLIDLFGNVPLITAYPAPPVLRQEKRAALFAFCEKELLESGNQLATDKAKPVYGRVNETVAYTLLAKLYLNAEIYAGQPKWNECVAMCEKVVAVNPSLRLTDNYFDNFRLRNENSPEIIFPIAFSSTIDLGFPGQNLYMRTLHYSQMPVSPWNGFCSIAEVYDSFDPTDFRRQVFWEGQQFLPLTWPQKSQSGVALKDRTGSPLRFTRTVHPTTNSEFSGIRVPKYEPDLNAPAGQAENDFVVFRLADVLLMKAESLFRLNRKAEALVIINTLRERAKLTSLTDLTSRGILLERQHELFWEGFARQDLIRFGEFLKPNSIRNRASEPHKTLLPIPGKVLAQNPAVIQNPGY